MELPADSRLETECLEGLRSPFAKLCDRVDLLRLSGRGGTGASGALPEAIAPQLSEREWSARESREVLPSTASGGIAKLAIERDLLGWTKRMVPVS